MEKSLSKEVLFHIALRRRQSCGKKINVLVWHCADGNGIIKMFVVPHITAHIGGTSK